VEVVAQEEAVVKEKAAEDIDLLTLLS